MVFTALAAVIFCVFLVQSIDTPNRTREEDAYLAALTVNMDADLAVKAGHAACELIPAAGERFAKEWLAGVDDFSRLGAVKRNPNPLSPVEAYAVVEAAVTHLCGATKP